MQKTSTQLNIEVSKVQQTMVPRKSTIDLIKQLARAYNYSRMMMPEGMRGIAMN